MNEKLYRIGDLQISIGIKDNIMPPSPYSLFLARNIPDLKGSITADVGTGCGIQAIVARLRGAKYVYLLDNNPLAVTAALSNAECNHIDGLIPLAPGDVLAPLPDDLLLDSIICNPASLPMKAADGSESPYYAGPDGRRMIERLICQSESRLKEGGSLYMVHTSVADFKASAELLRSLNFKYEVTATETLPFRPFYDRHWIDTIGGQSRGLYEIKSGQAVETLFMVVAIKEAQTKYVLPYQINPIINSYERISNEN